MQMKRNTSNAVMASRGFSLKRTFKPLPSLAAPAEQCREQQQFHHCYIQSQIAVSREEGHKEGPMPWRYCPGAPHRGTSEPTDPLAITHWEIPVPHTALPLLSLTTSPVLTCHHPLRGARSVQRTRRSCYWFFPRLALQSLGTASAGRGAA